MLWNVVVLFYCMTEMYSFIHILLNNLQMAVSPDATLNKVDQFATDFDKKVLKWKDAVNRYNSGWIWLPKGYLSTHSTLHEHTYTQLLLGIGWCANHTKRISVFLCVCRVFTVALLFNTLKRDCPSYQIIGDNGDQHVLQHTSHQSMVRKDKDHHWFHVYATWDCITGRDLQMMLPLLMWPHYPYKSSCHQLEIVIIFEKRLEFWLHGY